MFILLHLLLCGCSSLAYKKYACEREVPLHKAAGYIFQIGDCAFSKYIHIETGDYYRGAKWWIDLAVEVHSKDRNKTYEALHDFARSYNCDEQAFPAFADMLSDKTVEIFGENFSNGPRRVSLNIIDSIDKDAFLRLHCML